MARIDKFFNIYTVIIVFIATGLLYNFYNPLWCSPDEERHFGYCEYIAQNGRLPAYTTDTAQYSLNMGFHPPLYYLAASLLCSKDGPPLKEIVTINDGPGYRKILHPEAETKFPFSGKARSAYLLRMISLALCAAALVLLYRLGRIMMPDEPCFAAAVAAFVATIPQFQQVSISISNQSLMILLTTALTLCLILYLEKPGAWKRQAACGLLLGLCLLTRTAAILFIPVALCALAWVWFRDKRSTISDAVRIYGLALLVAGWWYLRNLILFRDPLLSKALLVHQPWVGQKVPLTADYFKTVAGTTFTSFFGDLGSLQLSLPPLHLAVYGALLLLGLTGCCLWLGLARKTMSSFQRQAMGLLLLALAGGLAQYAGMNLKFFGVYLGRYLFIVLAPLTMITFSGLRFLVPAPRRQVFWTVLSALLVVLNLSFCYQVLRPAYADPRLAETAGQPSFCCETPPVRRSAAIGQRFVSADDNLCAVRVMFARQPHRQDGEITFSLWEEGRQDRVLHRLTYPLNKISDSQRLVFIFPPVRKSAGKTYTFAFSSPADDGISLWYDRENRYPLGSRVQNGTDLNGDLYFSAYCFTGETPKTIWQGIAPAVINQDNYITIGELQFYLDLDENFQKTTITYQKIGLITKAVQNRQ